MDGRGVGDPRKLWLCCCQLFWENLEPEGVLVVGERRDPIDFLTTWRVHVQGTSESSGSLSSPSSSLDLVGTPSSPSPVSLAVVFVVTLPARFGDLDLADSRLLFGIRPNLDWTPSMTDDRFVFLSCSELTEGLLESVKAALFLLLGFLNPSPAASSVPSVPALRAFLFPPLSVRVHSNLTSIWRSSSPIGSSRIDLSPWKMPLTLPKRPSGEPLSHLVTVHT